MKSHFSPKDRSLYLKLWTNNGEFKMHKIFPSNVPIMRYGSGKNNVTSIEARNRGVENFGREF